MTEPLSVGIIGFGLAGRVFHAPLIAADPDLSLDAIVTSNPERAADAAQRYPGTAVLATTDELFARGLDLVVVASSNSSHAPLASAAMASGSAVVVDKPLATSSAQARALIDEATAAGVLLTVFQNRRWDGDFLTIANLLDDGVFGDVHQFESRFETWKPANRPGWKASSTVAEGGGLLYDLGPHLIDQALTLFGPVAGVYAELDTRRVGSVADDDVFVALTHESGVRSRLWMSAVVSQPGPRFRVIGSQGSYTTYGLDPQEKQLARGLAPDDVDFGDVEERDWGMLGFAGEFSPAPTLDGRYPEFYSRLARALRGEGPAPVDPRDSVAVLKIIEGIHRAQ